MRKLIAHALASLGFANVVEAVDGDDALREMQRNADFDLVLADIEMPIMNGIELIARIRADETPLSHDCRVIFLTGLSDVGILSLASSLEVQGFMAKPVSANMLVERLTKVLDSTPKIDVIPLKGRAIGEVGESQPAVSDHSAVSDGDGHVRFRQAKVRPVDLPVGAILDEDVRARGIVMLKAGARLHPGSIVALTDLTDVLDEPLVKIRVPV